MSYLRDLIAVGPFPYFSFIYFFFLSMYRVVLLRTKYKSGNHEDLGMTLGVAGLTLILRGGGARIGDWRLYAGWYYAVTIHKNVARSRW